MDITENGVPEAYRIVSIDPGSSTMGLAVIDVCPITFKPHLVYATTINVVAMINNFEQCVEVHGERIAKILAIQKAMYKFMKAWNPELVVSESPYMGRFPQAFAALTECLSSIRLALVKYNPTIPLFTIDPATVKMAVGVSGKSGDKNAMKIAVLGLEDLVNDSDIDMNVLDEHSIDAIAVGYTKQKQLFSGVNQNNEYSKSSKTNRAIKTK